MTLEIKFFMILIFDQIERQTNEIKAVLMHFNIY